MITAEAQRRRETGFNCSQSPTDSAYCIRSLAITKAKNDRFDRTGMPDIKAGEVDADRLIYGDAGRSSVAMMGALPKANRVAVSGGPCVLLLAILTYVRPEALSVLLSLGGLFALLLGTLVALGFGVFEWRRTTGLWMMPALTCAAFAAASIWLAAPIGRIVGDWEFRSHLNEYKHAVEVVTKDSVLGAGDCRPRVLSGSARDLPRRIALIRVMQCDEGRTIEFLVGTDVPLLHEGYVFRGYTDHDASVNGSLRIEARWPYTRHILGNWYRVADQPGF